MRLPACPGEAATPAELKGANATLKGKGIPIGGTGENVVWELQECPVHSSSLEWPFAHSFGGQLARGRTWCMQWMAKWLEKSAEAVHTRPAYPAVTQFVTYRVLTWPLLALAP